MINILYEDNHIIVVEKKPNIPVQEDSSKDLDMLTIIKKYIKDKYNKPGNVYLGLVHRLDRPVGGIMVFAKTSKAASRLCNNIRNNDFKKRYYALVHGKTKEKEVLKDYLLKNNKTNVSNVVDKNKGKESILEYKLLKYNKEKHLSLLEINLHTGRHHQIRVQLANINHPIYGDQKYGIDKVGIQIHLWAYEITFTHPVTKKTLTFTNNPNWKII
ncbi:MAG: RluA family pseudouridine synthase [Bacilli bacterium]